MISKVTRLKKRNSGQVFVKKNISLIRVAITGSILLLAFLTLWFALLHWGALELGIAFGGVILIIFLWLSAPRWIYDIMARPRSRREKVEKDFQNYFGIKSPNMKNRDAVKMVSITVERVLNHLEINMKNAKKEEVKVPIELANHSLSIESTQSLIQARRNTELATEAYESARLTAQKVGFGFRKS